MEAIHTNTHDNSSGTANETSDKITEKIGNKMRQARTHTRAPDISPKLKSFQVLTIRVNPKVTEVVVNHVGL
jgi:dihydrodipicolinate reductase